MNSLSLSNFSKGRPMTKITPEEALNEFWGHLGNGQTVMLGVEAPGNHTQPMTAFAEEENNLVWFFTRDDLSFATDVERTPDGRLILMSKDQEVYADVHGTMSLSRDMTRIDKYWNPMVAAWYPDGKADPHLTLVRFVPDEGQIWVSKQGLIRLAFQVAKANLSHTMPDVGGVTSVTFRN